MFPQVFELLAAAPAVTQIVGTTPPRIYRHGIAPQTPAGAYITWFVVYGRPENNLSDLPPADEYTVQVDCWSDNTGTARTQIETLARAVRDAIEPHHHVTGVVVNEQDAETQRFRIGLQVTFWTHR